MYHTKEYVMIHKKISSSLAKINHIRLQKKVILPFELCSILGNWVLIYCEINDEKSIIEQYFLLPRVNKPDSRCFSKQ